MRNVIIFISAVLCIMCVIILIKSSYTYRLFVKAIDAIYMYNCSRFDLDVYCDRISYDCLGDFNKISLNVFDWGYKNIVPPDIFEKIKPYLEEVK